MRSVATTTTTLYTYSEKVEMVRLRGENEGKEGRKKKERKKKERKKYLISMCVLCIRSSIPY